MRVLALVAALVVGAGVSAGAETLEIPGLSAPATVHTDTLGVPHILAATLEDAVRAQGWVHARDRFFQMDASRRRAEGTLAELTGGVLDLGSDFFLRPLDLRAAAQRSLALLGDEERALFQAYADGVNAWRVGHPLPPEYAELEVSRVRPWSVLDSLLVVEIFGVSLSLLVDTDFSDWFGSWVEAGDAAQPPFDGEVLLNEDMIPFAPPEPVATLPDAGSALPIVPLAAPLAARAAAGSGGPSPLGLELARRYRARVAGVPLAARALDPRARSVGSNAWGVSAAQSADGAPIVANDAHFLFAMPTVGYENHLLAASDPVAGSLNLSGVSIPGISLIVVGQSDRLAWGATNTQWDHADVFEDRLLRGDPACPAQLCIDSAGALHTVEVTEESFRRNAVGNGTLDDLDDVATLAVPRVPFRSFGPILELEDPGLAADPGGAPAETTVLTLQFVGLHGTREAEALLGFARAADVFEFRDAVELFDIPSQNWVVADVAGNLGYFASGEAPLRADLEAGVVLSPPEIVRDGSGPSNWVADPARSQGHRSRSR